MFFRWKYRNIPPYLKYKGGFLHYENINLPELLNKYGSPLEVAYTDMITQKVRYLKSAFQSSIDKFDYKGKYFYTYATKANYYSEVVTTSLNTVDFLETSSGHDLDIIEKLFKKKLINKGFTVICNGFKKGYYLERIISLQKEGLNIIPVIENEDEAESLINQPLSFNVGIRINIDDKVKSFTSEGRSGAAVDTRFGMYFKDMLNYAHKINKSDHLKLTLFHFHLGGTINDIGKYVSFLTGLLEKNYVPLKLVSPNLEFFDIGGGFPTQYNQDFKFNYQKLTDAIIKTVKSVSDRHRIPHPHIIGEHGRYTVADHSFFLYEISVVKKSSLGSYWYLINSSLMNYLPDSWALGQDFVILPLNLMGNRMVKVKLGGLTCDPDDTYYKQEKKNFLYLPQIKPSEKLYIGIFGTGAYQEMIAGVGGVHHCMIPEGNELIIVKHNNQLKFNKVNNAQTKDQLLDILDYEDAINLKQYINH